MSICIFDNVGTTFPESNAIQGRADARPHNLAKTGTVKKPGRSVSSKKIP
jgi:hypothetical protein